MGLCVAFGCDANSSKNRRVSFFRFPREPKRRKLWINRLNRGETATRKYVPSSRSSLCMKHFDDSQYIIAPQFAQQIGYDKPFRLRLKKDAVPTIFETPVPAKLQKKERKSAVAITKKKMVNEIQSSLRKPAATDEIDLSKENEKGPDFTAIPFLPPTQPTMSITTTPMETKTTPVLSSTDLPDFTAIPFPPTSTTPTMTVTTTSMVTTTAVSNTYCHTVQSRPCPLSWLADYTSTVPRLQPICTAVTFPTQPDIQTVTNSFPVPMDSDQPIDAPETTSKSAQSFSTQTQTPYNLVKRRSMKVQCQKVITEEKATQTSPYSCINLPDSRPGLGESLNDSLLSIASEDMRDPDWKPVEEVEPDDDEDKQQPVKTEKKFIVFESCLDSILNSCSVCGSGTIIQKRTIGTCLICDITCTSCDYKSVWHSQPMSGNLPMGNLILCAAIMFCGSSPVKVLRALDFAGIQNLSSSTFNAIQSAYLSPSVMKVWKKHQQLMVADIQKADRPLRLAGDMRCCTPGHTAKYGSYSVIDLEASKVLDFQLVQSNEVKNSYAMEMEGLKRALEWIVDIQNLIVTDLVTDRHSSIKKFMREENPHINHWFDVWHAAKGVYKKLEASGKKKGCQKVKDWARSISNHMYWCAASSGGDGELVQQKWLSILNHITNVHEGHGEKFPQCEHGPLEDRDWMKKGFKPYAEVEKIVKGRLLFNDVKKLSPTEQTSSLESFHNIVCTFASKSVHYFYTQMEARLALAALHFNENSCRSQAVNKDGERQWAISFPKSRRGEAIAKEVKNSATFGKSLYILIAFNILQNKCSRYEEINVNIIKCI